MGLLKIGSGMLAVVAISLLVVSGGAFSHVSADRSVQASVVPDDRAFVGYDAVSAGDTVRDGETVTLIEVTNRVTSDIDVTKVDIEIVEGELNGVDKAPYPTGIAPGDSDRIDAELRCDQETDVTLAVTVKVSGNAFGAELYGDTRTFELTCEPPITEETGVVFYGQGDAMVASSPSEPVPVEVWVYDDGNLRKDPGNKSVYVDDPIFPEMGTPRNYPIVAVHFIEEGITYKHPDYDMHTNNLSLPADGGPGEPVEDPPANW